MLVPKKTPTGCPLSKSSSDGCDKLITSTCKRCQVIIRNHSTLSKKEYIGLNDPEVYVCVFHRSQDK